MADGKGLMVLGTLDHLPLAISHQPCQGYSSTPASSASRSSTSSSSMSSASSNSFSSSDRPVIASSFVTFFTGASSLSRFGLRSLSIGSSAGTAQQARYQRATAQQVTYS